MKNLSLFASALAVLGLTACEKTLVDDIMDVGNGQVKNSVLQVRTRSGGSLGDEATVAYPVTVYVFQGEECQAVQTIGEEGQTLNIPLTEGTYSVYAVGGASASDYVLPDADDATVTSAIALCEGHEHGDLMAASATAMLVDSGTNTVTLGMTRKTMLIQNVTIKKIPTAATAVSVTIAPLWQSLTVGGTYSTMNGSNTIGLTRQEDGRTWQNAASAYQLPPCSQPASVSVNITIGGMTKTYTYSCRDQLEAGYKINIDDGISDWRLPTYDELNVIYAALSAINDTFESDVNASGKYLYDASGTILYRILSQTAADGADNFAATARIRPVATVSITKD